MSTVHVVVPGGGGRPDPSERRQHLRPAGGCDGLSDLGWTVHGSTAPRETGHRADRASRVRPGGHARRHPRRRRRAARRPRRVGQCRRSWCPRRDASGSWSSCTSRSVWGPPAGVPPSSSRGSARSSTPPPRWSRRAGGPAAGSWGPTACRPVGSASWSTGRRCRADVVPGSVDGWTAGLRGCGDPDEGARRARRGAGRRGRRSGGPARAWGRRRSTRPSPSTFAAVPRPRCLQTASGSPAPASAATWMPCTRRRTSWSPRRGPRPTAWSSPRRSRAASPSWAAMSAGFRRRSVARPTGGCPASSCRPGTPRRLAVALRRWLTDAGLRADLRRAARERRATLTDWSVTADRLSAHPPRGGGVTEVAVRVSADWLRAPRAGRRRGAVAPTSCARSHGPAGPDRPRWCTTWSRGAAPWAAGSPRCSTVRSTGCSTTATATCWPSPRTTRRPRPTGSLVTVETRQGDVTRLRPEDLAGASLVTASALLDILTADELDRLVRCCVAAGCPPS